jgi:hypothetical protein
MKAMLPVMAVLALLVNVAASKKQSDEGCTVNGWTDGLTARPIFKCPDKSQR